MNEALVEMYRTKSNKRIKSNGQSAPNKTELQVIPLENLHGMDDAASLLTKIVSRYKSNPERKRLPYLISASECTGKTSLVEAIAHKFATELDFLKIELKSEIVKAAIEEKLQRACLKPSILFFDDLHDKPDLLSQVAYIVEQALKHSRPPLIICSALPESLNPEILKKFRFVRTIQLQRPNAASRLKIIKYFISTMKYALTEDDAQVLASKTPAFKAFDLAKMFLIAEDMTEEEDEQGENAAELQVRHCIAAIEEVKKSFGKTTFLVSEKPNVNRDQVVGFDHVFEEFNKRLGKINSIDCDDDDDDDDTTSILLYGPPGCGKTMIAKAMANEAELNFISIKPSELLDKYVGETERNIRKVFAEAKEHEPCMIYFDEFEALCGSRGSKENGTQAIQTLLAEMDGFNSKGKSFVLAATNRLEDIDPAARRPGRFEPVEIGPPNKEARWKILKKLSTGKSWETEESVNLEELACITEKYTGAALKCLFSHAKTLAKFQQKNSKPYVITKKHIKEAFDKMLERRR